MYCCVTDNKVEEHELDDFEEKEESFDNWHNENDRGKRIAFFQGACDARLRNRALIAFETSFHQSYAAALLCIKVNMVFLLKVKEIKKLKTNYLY